MIIIFIMNLKIIIFFLITLLYSPIFIFAQGENVEDFDKGWLSYKNQQTTLNRSLKKEIEDFDIGESIDTNKYLEVNDLWQRMAQQLKQLIDDPYTKRFSQSNENNDELLRVWRSHIAERFNLLRIVGNKRVKAMNALRKGGKNIFLIDRNLVSNMYLEIELVPYKIKSYVHEKSFWIKENLSGGLRGILSLFLQGLLFILIILIPVVFIKSSRYAHDALNKQKNKSFYLSYKSKTHRFLTNFLPFFIGLLPWLLALLAIRVMDEILYFSEFREFKFGLPYFNYYIYYKIFRLSLEFFLQNFAAQFDAIKQSDVGKKAKRTSLILGLFLFVTYSLKEAFQSILGPSLTFSILEPLFVYSTIAVLFYLGNKWKEEIRSYLNQTGNKYLQKNEIIFKKQYSFFLSLPLAFFILAHYLGRILISWGGQFDFIKLIYAKILRIKIESSQKIKDGEKEVPNEYKKHFLEKIDTSEVLMIEESLSEKVFEQVKKWNSNTTDEQTVAIHGARGSGKTKILQYFKSSKKWNDFNVEFLSVPERLFTNKNLENFLEKYNLNNASDDRKKIILVDDAHNMFLSTIGGFEVYKKFLEIIESRRDIFWIVSFNEQPWIYLNSVLGKNQYFRLELKTPRWSLEKVKSFILETHKSTNYQIRYNQIFKSSQNINDELSSVENRYFYLLWEKSGGNPGQSIQLWFRSIHPLFNQTLEVSLPRENNISEFNKLHQDMHFTYSSLVKHENLTVSEATRATNLPRAVVKQSLYRGIEEGFLVVDAGRYTISMDWSLDLLKFLKGKNLVYESNK